MLRRRGLRTRLAKAQLELPEHESLAIGRPSGAACHKIDDQKPQTEVKESQTAHGSHYFVPGDPERDLTNEEQCVPVQRARTESTDTPDLNESAYRSASQEDACFHSPRSLPGDTSEEKTPVNEVPLDEGVMRSEPPDTTEIVSQYCESSCQAEAQVTHDTSSPPYEQLPVTVDLKVREHLCSETINGVPTTGPSSVSASQDEWIRSEGPSRESAAATVPDTLSSCCVSPGSTERELLSLESPTSFVAEAPPPKVSITPICVGSATQAEEGAGTDRTSIEELTNIGSGEWSERQSHIICSEESLEGNATGTRSRRFLPCTSDCASFFARFTSGQCSQKQVQHDIPNCEEENATICPSHLENSQQEEGGFFRKAAQWHRCLLEMYAGPVEDITRLTLQVLPAHATDEKSERRLLVIQGLFDVFCIYRSHFLSPPEDLQQAEVLHQQWRLCAENSLRGTGSSRASDPPRHTQLFSDKSCLKGGYKEGVLPASVRLTLYGAASLALKIVRALQLLLEINKFRQGGEGNRLALCLRLELLKLILKMILHSLMPFAFYCDEQSISQALDIHREKQMAADADRMRPCYGRRTGRRIPPLPSAVPQSNDKQSTIIAAPALHPAPRQLARLVILWLLKELKEFLSGQRVHGLRNRLASNCWRLLLGEILYHLRPFIHLYLLKRARSNKSWTPWLVTLFVEAYSISLLHGSPQVMEHLSPIEAAELRRRQIGLPYALLRPPFFDKFLARPFEAVDYIAKRVPLLNYFNVLDVFLVYRDLYFTTSNT